MTPLPHGGSEEPDAEEIRRRFDDLVEAAGLGQPGPAQDGADSAAASRSDDGGAGWEEARRATGDPVAWPDETGDAPASATGPHVKAGPSRTRSRWWRRSRDEDYDPEFHFHPDPPAPLPRHDLGFWATVVGLVGGCLLTLYVVLLHPQAHPLLRWVAGAMVAAGFVLLVLRSPTERDEDDDGARV